MHFLRTFGGLALESDGKPGTGAAGQRARVAILAFIATAGESGVSRELITALFWPESDSDRAHGSLKQALYTLRRDAKEQELTLGTTTLRLNPAVIRSDVGDFQSAIAAKKLEDAVAHYSGVFLEGIHLPGNAEFERWLDRERERLSHDYASALETLAETAASKGNHKVAAQLWRQLAATDMLNARTARAYMSALADSGDCDAALKHGQLYQRLVKSELGVDPDASVAVLMGQLRSMPREQTRVATHAVKQPEETSATRLPPPTAGTRPLYRTPLMVLLVVVAFGVLAWRWDEERSASERLKAVAFLPCESMSRDTSQAYLGDRWTDELINKLFKVGGLRPKSFLSVQRYRASSKTAREIGTELNAGSLVRCRVSEDSSSIRLAIQLIRSSDDGLIWSNEYDEPAGIAGINAAQSAAALDIARVLRAGTSQSLASTVEHPLTEDSAALRLYRLGRHLYNSGGPGDMQRSVQYFKEAIARDSSFARAYVALADAIGFVGEGELRPAVEWQPEVERYLRKALALDASIPEAHSSLAFYYSEYAYDSLSAEQQYRRALELNPNSVDAHLWMGFHRFISGRTSDAIDEYQRAIELDPLLPLARMHLARALIFTGQYERAEPYLEQGTELFPQWPPLAHLRATSLIAQGMKDSAVKVLNRAEKSSWNGYLYGIAGRPDVTRSILDSLMIESKRRPLDPCAIAVLQMGLGDKEQAIAWLQKAYAERSVGLRYVLGPDPIFRSIRADPRIQDLRRRVGFPL